MTGPMTHSLVRTLREVADFSAFPDEALVEAVGASANLLWPSGGVVFDEGGPAQAVYVVLRGRVRIRTDDAETLAELGPGAYFGEQAVLLRTTHSARAEAVEDSELMVIPKSSFESLLDAAPEVAAGFRRRLEQRLAERRDRPGASPSADVGSEDGTDAESEGDTGAGSEGGTGAGSEGGTDAGSGD